MKAQEAGKTKGRHWTEDVETFGELDTETAEKLRDSMNELCWELPNMTSKTAQLALTAGTVPDACYEPLEEAIEALGQKEKNVQKAMDKLEQFKTQEAADNIYQVLKALKKELHMMHQKLSNLRYYDLVDAGETIGVPYVNKVHVAKHAYSQLK